MQSSTFIGVGLALSLAINLWTWRQSTSLSEALHAQQEQSTQKIETLRSLSEKAHQLHYGLITKIQQLNIVEVVGLRDAPPETQSALASKLQKHMLHRSAQHNSAYTRLAEILDNADIGERDCCSKQFSDWSSNFDLSKAP